MHLHGELVLVLRALTGDKSALKLIGQMGNDGAKISEFAPQVREQMLAAIKGTEDLNVVLSDIYKQAGVSGEKIERSVQSAILADTHLANILEEIQLDFASSKEKEALRHQQATDHLLLKAWVDKHMMQVDGEYKMLPVLQEQPINAAISSCVLPSFINNSIKTRSLISERRRSPP